MNKIKFFLSILYLLALTTTASAKIREIKYMAEALMSVVSGDFVVLDIDNTIMETPQTLGSVQWYDYLIDKYKQSGLSEDQAINRAISDWVEVQLVTQVQPVESATPALIRCLQNKNIQVIALTARPVELKNTTITQLLSLGVSFQDYNLSYSSSQEIHFYRGILFVGPKHNKGIALWKFLKANGLTPQRLIFIDDKPKNVKDMDEAFTPTGLTNINFRYGAADAKVKSFNPQIAQMQWDYFKKTGGKLLTDEQALADIH